MIRDLGRSINMMQRKPNPELAQAAIDAQPSSVVYKPHPKRPGVMQKFCPTFSIDANAKRIIDYGKPMGNYRLCNENEKPDAMIYSHEHQMIKGYVKI